MHSCPFGTGCFFASSLEGEEAVLRSIPGWSVCLLHPLPVRDLGSLFLKVLGGACSLFPSPLLRPGLRGFLIPSVFQSMLSLETRMGGGEPGGGLKNLPSRSSSIVEVLGRVFAFSMILLTKASELSRLVPIFPLLFQFTIISFLA